MIKKNLAIIGRYLIWISFVLAILVWIIRGHPYLLCLWVLHLEIALLRFLYLQHKIMRIVNSAKEETLRIHG